MKLMIAEDDDLHRAFLRTAVEALIPDCDEIIEVADGASAIDIARRSDPDSIILDLQMPRVTGVEAARAIWGHRPETRILFWSNYAEEAYIRGISKIVPESAVYGYVLKSASEDRLRVAIRGVFLSDQCVIDREVRGIQSRTDGRDTGLTETDYEVLLDVALGLTDKAIAERRHVSVRGIQSRLQHLYQRLGVDQAALRSGEQRRPVFNARTRVIYLALARGLINADALRRGDDELRSALSGKDEPG